MIKGTTRIELTDVNTGEVEVVEEENMVTNAIRDIFAPMGLVKSAGTMYSTDYVEYYTTITGGLLLLDKRLDEDPDNYFLPVDVKQTGCAVYNQQNTTNQTLRGNYNATESEFSRTEKRVKYVYDFDTAEANGTIACVALTHAYGGYGIQGCEKAPTRGVYPFFKTIGSGLLKLSGGSSGLGAYDRSLTYTTYGTGYTWIFKVDGVKDLAYYFTITSTSSVSVRWYRANIKTLSFFDRPGTYRRFMGKKDVTLSQTISTQYFSYSYDDEAEKLYIVSCSYTSISKNEAFIITEIDLANDCNVTQYSMTNKTGISLQTAFYRGDTLCYRGYIYLMSLSAVSNTYPLYREEIGNSANVEKLSPSPARSCFPVYARDGKIFLEASSSTASNAGFYIVDADDFSVSIPETATLYDSNLRQYIPVVGYPLNYYLTKGNSDGTFALRTDYLATINNLSSAVVKTADKTMKVTYTLQEVDEE
jgi:hypothetical protein